MEIKKESHMQSIIEKDGELYENTKLWVSIDSLLDDFCNEKPFCKVRKLLKKRIKEVMTNENN